MKRPAELFRCLLLFCLAAAVLAGVPPQASGLSLEEEEKLGREFLIDVKKQFSLVEDDFAVDYLNRLGRHLAEAVQTKPFPFKFYLIQKNDLNAFAGPGAHIFFFTGLVEAMETVDELAAVASHEIAHITARHLSKRIEQNKKISMATMAGILAGVLIGGEAMGAITTGAMAAGVQAQLAFSRSDERQADQLGFKYMRASGFDPSAMLQVLKRMQSAQVYGTDQVPAYLRTHPTGPVRMANMDSLLEGGGPVQATRMSESLRRQYPAVRTLLAARYGDPEAAERRFKRQLEADPDAALAHFGLGLLKKEEAEYETAERHLKQAVEGRPDLVPARIHLGEAYQLAGRYEEALPVLKAVLDSDPDNRSALFLTAVSYQNLENYSRAATIYERLLNMEPVQEEIYYNLGLCYGRMDRLAPAHYHFGVFFQRTGKPGKAGFHFEKAEELGRHDMELLHKIQKAKEDLRSK